jgi:hypothetical protein
MVGYVKTTHFSFRPHREKISFPAKLLRQFEKNLSNTDLKSFKYLSQKSCFGWLYTPLKGLSCDAKEIIGLGAGTFKGAYNHHLITTLTYIYSVSQE